MPRTRLSPLRRAVLPICYDRRRQPRERYTQPGGDEQSLLTVIHPHSHAYRQISAKMFIELLPRSIKRRSTHHIRFVPLDFHWQRMHDVEREITDQNKIKITVPKLVGNFF
jgi:hypothetical protein